MHLATWVLALGSWLLTLPACGRVYVTVRCLSVCPSVCPIYRPLQQRAAGLLLWALQAGDIDRLLHGASAAAGAAASRSISATGRLAANASSVRLSADVEAEDRLVGLELGVRVQR